MELLPLVKKFYFFLAAFLVSMALFFCCSFVFQRNNLQESVKYNTGLVAFEGVKNNRSDTMSFWFMPEGGYIEENKVLALLDNKTYHEILPLMNSENISRKEKIEILNKSSPTKLCETGRFGEPETIKCRFHFVENGYLVVFPTTEDIGFYFIESLGFYATATQYYWEFGLETTFKVLLVLSTIKVLLTVCEILIDDRVQTNSLDGEEPSFVSEFIASFDLPPSLK